MADVTSVDTGEMLLATLFTGRFRVIKPIPVKISYCDGGVIAEWCEVAEYGSAKSRHGALNDLVGCIISLYSVLESERDNLGGNLLHVFHVLQQYIERVRPAGTLPEIPKRVI